MSKPTNEKDMPKPTLRLEDLQDGQEVHVRTARYREGTDGPEWSGWEKAALRVQRHKGKVVALTLRDRSWAEYTPADFSVHYMTFEAEGYYMEILEMLGEARETK